MPTWLDRSGNGRTISQTEPPKQPLWQNAVLGNGPGAYLPDYRWWKNVYADALISAQQHTVIAVAARTTDTAENQTLLNVNSTHAGNHWQLYWSQTYGCWYYWDSAGNSINTAQDWPLNQRHVWSWTIDGGTAIKLRKDGTQIFSAPIIARPTGQESWNVGSIFDGNTAHLAGDILSLLLYKRLLAPIEIAQAEAWLKYTYNTP